MLLLGGENMSTSQPSATATLCRGIQVPCLAGGAWGWEVEFMDLAFANAADASVGLLYSGWKRLEPLVVRLPLAPC
jgi:hypothetical protein